MLLEPRSPLRCPINTNIIKTVNNNWKVGKFGWIIKEGSKIFIGICTTVDHIETKLATDLQDNSQLSRENWSNKLSSSNILEKINVIESSSLNISIRSRQLCITNIIDGIKEELILSEFLFGIHDCIDIAVQNFSKSNMSSKCSSVCKKASRKSRKPLFDSLDHEVNYESYQRILSQHPTEKNLKFT